MSAKRGVTRTPAGGAGDDADAGYQLRNQLSIERTKLSNERTLLAYIRTALALVITGAGIRQFLDADVWMWVGAIMLGLGAVVLIVGFWRFYTVRGELTDRPLILDDDD